MKKIKICLICILFLTVLFACKKKRMVLKVDSEGVSVSDFKDKMKEASYYYSKNFINTEQGKKQILDGVLKETIMLALAKKSGYNKKEEYKIKLKNFEKQMLITDFIKDLRVNEFKVTDQDIQKAYQNNKAYYDKPLEIQVAHILVTTKNEAEEILNEIKKGADFTVLASSRSLDTSSANNGGRLDWFSKGEMVPEFEAAAFAIKDKDGISNIVKTNFGYHIIKKLDERIGKPVSFDDIKFKLSKILERQKFDKWFEAQKEKVHIKVNEKLLKNINIDREK